MPTGLLAAALSYALWGLFPLYFHQVSEVPAFEICCTARSGHWYSCWGC